MREPARTVLCSYTRCMSDLAELLGAHAVLALIIVSLVLLLVTWVLWRLTQRFGDALWNLAGRLWDLVARSPLGRFARRLPGVRAKFTRSLSVWRYLGIHAIASLAVAILGLLAFVELIDEIGADEELGIFDEQLATALRQHVSEPTLDVFATITHIGDRNFTIGVGIVVALFFIVRRWWLHLVVWALATGVGGLLVSVLKDQFQRARPLHEHSLTDTTSWSFPSGHAAGAVFVYGMLGYLVLRHAPTAWHIPIAFATLTLIVFVGFSRVILHVHYLSDVLAGFAVAGAWIGLWIAAFEVARRHKYAAGRQSTEVTEAA